MRFPRKFEISSGFTLLELLVVMVIIGLLASYVAPRFFTQVGKSEVKTARAQIDAFGKALDTYRLDTGHYPTTVQGLKALIDRPEGEAKWSGPYLQKSVPPDPWGQTYIYQSPGGAGRDYDLTSTGKDAQPGGEGDAADIRSWELAK
ncbi:MAG: type II secretion system protein GspG [Rubrivivax sp.]|nr:MAG: type II secretion system protein GspG [Rubrivivax sp.]